MWMEPGYSSANGSIDYQAEYVVKKHKFIYLRNGHIIAEKPDREKQTTALKLVTQK